jgi:hypothetical protein
MHEMISASVQGELEQLRRRVDELERQHQQDRNTLVAVQAERDEYLRFLYAWSRKQHSRDELERWASEEREAGVSYEEIIAASESSDGGKKCPQP